MMVRVRAKMTTGTGTIECAGALTPVRGLAVAVTPKGPAVVHLRSGMTVGGYADAEAALAAAIELGPLWDWTCPGADLTAGVLPPAVKAAILAVCDRWVTRRGSVPTAEAREDLPLPG